jgi:hypothetical protein
MLMQRQSLCVTQGEMHSGKVEGGFKNSAFQSSIVPTVLLFMAAVKILVCFACCDRELVCVCVCVCERERIGSHKLGTRRG